MASPPMRGAKKGRDLEPAKPAKAELVRDVATQNPQEGVDWIVMHGGNLAEFRGAMPDIRGFPKTGYEARCC